MTDWHLQGESTFTVGQRSVAGKKAANEDAIGIRIPEGLLLSTKGVVAIIADGVSAAEAGKEASESCVHNFINDYYSTPDTWSVKKSTTQVLTALNRWLYGLGRQYADVQKGYVSTLSSLVIKSNSAYVFHVGDTRICRIRDGEFVQLTRDHTTVISSEQSYLARAMGLDVKLDVDCRELDVLAGDIFFLSSDGIHDFVKPETICQDILQSDDYERCCESLIDLALKEGSADNLSCQIVRVDSLPERSVDEVSRQLAQLPFPPDLEPGMILDGFKVVKVLHASNRSQLYKVQCQESNKYYCMKTPSDNYNDDAAYIERFIMEGWIGKRINNPHVVKVFEPVKAKTFLYYLTEYIGGLTLEQWIKENPQPPIQEVRNIIKQVGVGLRGFHRRETYHQDIKPGNIMLDKDGQALIIDFGSCYVKGIAEIDSPLQRDEMLGTASYSAPEMVLHGQCSAQSDIFSLAIIVFEMLTGELPFAGKLETCRTVSAYKKTQYIASFELNELVPVWIDGAIKRGLRYEPERRYEEVSEFIHELENPNPKYKKYYQAALAERNPEFLWQMISAGLFVAFCIALYY